MAASDNAKTILKGSTANLLGPLITSHGHHVAASREQHVVEDAGLSFPNCDPLHSEDEDDPPTPVPSDRSGSTIGNAKGLNNETDKGTQNTQRGPTSVTHHHTYLPGSHHDNPVLYGAFISSSCHSVLLTIYLYVYRECRWMFNGGI
jgi:hypothetical protein